MTEKEVLVAISGVDENYEAKSQIRIETKFVNPITGEETTEQVLDLHGPVVNCFRSYHFMNVDVQFDSASDPYLIQVAQMLTDFCKPENSMDDTLVPVIHLTVLPFSLGGEYFVAGTNASWNIVPSQPNRLPDTIRFIFMNGDFFTYKTNGSSMDFNEIIEKEV